MESDPILNLRGNKSPLPEAQRRVEPVMLHHAGLRALLLLVGCFTSQQHASVSKGRICSDSCTCCHTEIEVLGLTYCLNQSQYADTGPTTPKDELYNAIRLARSPTALSSLKSLSKRVHSERRNRTQARHYGGGRLNH